VKLDAGLRLDRQGAILADDPELEHENLVPAVPRNRKARLVRGEHDIFGAAKRVEAFRQDRAWREGQRLPLHHA
jgi:hypothetical protein